MNFERGREVKDALSIGIKEKARDFIDTAWDLYRENLYDKTVKKNVEDAFFDHIGVPLKIKYNKKTGLYFLIKLSGKGWENLDIRFTIRRYKGTNDTGPK